MTTVAPMDPEGSRLVELREELVARIDTSAAETRRHAEALAAETRAHVDRSAAETRRHFDIVAESLVAQVQLVAEGVLTVDQKVERFGEEMRAGFRQVDGRLLRLEARVSQLERRVGDGPTSS